MVKYVMGDLLTTDADIICHQVNVQGVMGGGLAFHIARKYPDVEKTYVNYKPKRVGEVCFAYSDDGFIIANCFSQNADFTTNYDALRECLLKVRERMDESGMITVAIPYKYGCGIAKGDWETVFEIFNDVFADKTLMVYNHN